MTLSIILAAALAAPAPAKISHKVEIDGRVYRVEVRGDLFQVFNKSTITPHSIGERDLQRRAVKKATGCAAVDELDDLSGRLQGRLQC